MYNVSLTAVGKDSQDAEYSNSVDIFVKAHNPSDAEDRITSGQYDNQILEVLKQKSGMNLVSISEIHDVCTHEDGDEDESLLLL